MLPLQQFSDFIKTNALFSADDKILLAVSGGKDSVLMVQLFKQCNYNFSIAHCNFNLRGDEAQRDESFVRLLAHTLDVPFHVAHFDTKSYASTNHVSTQMAARTLRYNWFEEIRAQNGYQFIAVAQHQNDAIETLLLNLTRGTGISGLHGILPKRDFIIRPLLFLSRQEIENFVEDNSLDFVEDSSNQTTKYARNSIRLNVVPHLQAINPNLERTFAQNINRFAETEQVLKQVVAETRQKLEKRENDDVSYDLASIENLTPKRLLFYELIKPFSFTESVADEILDSLAKQSGTSFYSQTHRATIDRTAVIISKLSKASSTEHHFLHINEEFKLVDNQKISLFKTDSLLFEANKFKAFVDADKLIFPLIIRYKQEGDRFMPLGMRNFKKLSDFLINQKIPLPQKERIILLINGNGEVIWVAGLRQDDRYKVNATTKKVAIFELSNQ